MVCVIGSRTMESGKVEMLTEFEWRVHKTNKKKIKK